MDKILRRTRTAERVSAKRTKRRTQIARGVARRRLTEEIRATYGELRQNVRDARQNRRDAWELGPIAPKLDIGTGGHGVVHQHQRTKADSVHWSKHVAERCRWAGTPQFLNLVPRDRVVILEGPDKGKIDEVKSINLASGTVVLKKYSKINIKLPEWMDGAEERPFVAQPYNLPISAVRLVHPLRDPATGAVRDVIIRQLASGPVLWDRRSGFRTWRRYVPGLNVTIPWPEREVAERKDQKFDSPRAAVEERTFVPTLLRPPVPQDLVNQLRNQFSRFRTRHEDWYIAKKEAEEAEKKARKTVADSMLTPVDELKRMQKAERKARGQPVLTDEMLEKLGRIVSANKAAAPRAVGVAEGSSGSGASTASMPLETSAPESRPPPPQ